jgi:glyoxylase-like metal-dependent hydrolase (beta-lactamase superfamily II)
MAASADPAFSSGGEERAACGQGGNAMNGLIEVLPDIWTWSVFNEEKQINFNGHLVIHGGESVLIDPPPLEGHEQDQLQELLQSRPDSPLKAVLLANGHHDRAGDRMRELFRIPVLVHEADTGFTEYEVDGTFRDGERLACGLQTVTVPNQKTPGETAFYLVDRKVLIVGDALIGRVKGKVNLLPPDKYADPGKAREGIRTLLKLEFDALLVGDGHSITQNAKDAVGAFSDGS